MRPQVARRANSSASAECAGRWRQPWKKARTNSAWIITRPAPGPPGIATWPTHFWRSCSSSAYAASGKKSPALTIAQARQLIAQAIDEAARPLRDVITILHYRQRRNHAAYRSHRKRTLRRLKQRTKRKKRKTSK